ncbi:MAG: hypothetical protein WD342_04325 [Verrucomicrobiales bacterium]
MAYAPDPDDLAKFVEKALEIQLSDLDEPLTEEVLAKIARKAGLSDDDWKRVCSRLEEHLQKGRNFLTFENYGDAIIELEQAAALAPYRAEVLCDCGKAHLKNWKERGVKESRERSEELLLRSLEIDPVNVEAAELLSEHRKPDPATFTRGKKTAIVAAALSLTVASWIGISSLPSETADRNEEAIIYEIQFGKEGARDSYWIWGSGGELVLKADGTARHTEWKRDGGWSLNPDGSIFLEGPTGTFRIAFLDGVGHARHLQRGGSTTLVAKK